MATAQDVLRVAESQVGYSRWDDPQPGTKYGRWYADLTGEPYYGESGVPYCAMFVSWVFDQAGAECAGLPGAYCPSMLAEAEAVGAAVKPTSARPGDVVYYDWGGDGETDHVGIVVENHGSYLTTIEGNTSTGSGSQTNGGVVAERQRSWDYVCGVVRPNYDSESGGGTSTGILDVDGHLGPLSVAEWQRQCGTTVDGIVSGQSWECMTSYPNLESVTYEGTGSDLMRKVQEMVGVDGPTGVIAGGTVASIQSWLIMHGYDCTYDRAGILGPETAKAIQRSLNDGAWA